MVEEAKVEDHLSLMRLLGDMAEYHTHQRDKERQKRHG
jgi:hypothetical protein